MHPDHCRAIAIRPFWSRNRLTFLQIARYQGHARSRFNARVTPYGCDHHRPSRRRTIPINRPILIAATSDAAMRARPVHRRGIRDAGCGQDDDGLGQGAYRAASFRLPRSGWSLTRIAAAQWTSCWASSAETLPRALCGNRVDEGGLLDPVMAQVGEQSVELIVDADEAERAAALAVATSRAGLPLRLNDIAADKSAARLRQLSDEVSRIAATLARLSTGPAPMPKPLEATPSGELPAVSADTVRSVIRARRLRSRFFPEESSPTRRGTCFSTCFRRRSRTCACRSRACALRRRSRRHGTALAQGDGQPGNFHPPRRPP